MPMVIPRLTHCAQQANRPHRVARMRRRQGTVLNRFSPRRKLYQISCPLGCLILTPHEPISIPNWKLATLELLTLPHWQHFRPRSVGRAHTLARPSGCLRQCSLRGFASSVHVLGEPPPRLHESHAMSSFLPPIGCHSPTWISALFRRRFSSSRLLSARSA